MQLFYEPNILLTSQLNEEESRHAIKVLRHKIGDSLNIIDGKGNFYEVIITFANEKKCAVSIVKTIVDFDKKDYYFHLAIAPTKNMDRMEWLVEKCVEIGVDEISFVHTKNSERKEIKINRLEKIAISAMKQSKKATLPKINEMQKLDDFLKKEINGEKYIAHLEEGYRFTIIDKAEKNNNYCILIGPEGDFNEEEVYKAQLNGYIPVTLGKSRLRTETAGVVACTIFNSINF